jgi:hypothetical protein
MMQHSMQEGNVAEKRDPEPKTDERQKEIKDPPEQKKPPMKTTRDQARRDALLEDRFESTDN